MTQPLRVLWITNMDPVSPIRGIYVGMQATALRALGGVEIDVAVVAEERGGARDYFLANARVRRQWNQGRYDLAHIHYGITGLAALLLPPRVPMVATLYGSDLNQRSQSLITRAVTRRCLRRIFVSRRLAEQWPSGRNVVIPNGVDFEHCRPKPREAACRALGLDPTRRYVLFGSFPHAPVKGYDVFCEVLERIRRRHSQVEPLILSEANQPYDRVVDKLNAADVLLFTSRRGHEGSPTVIKEAVAVGLPVVTVDVGDVRDTLEGVRPGRVIDWPSPGEDRDAWLDRLAEAVGEVFADGGRANGRELRSHLSLDRIAERTLALYREVVAGAPFGSFGGLMTPG